MKKAVLVLFAAAVTLATAFANGLPKEIQSVGNRGLTYEVMAKAPGDGGTYYLLFETDGENGGDVLVFAGPKGVSRIKGSESIWPLPSTVSTEPRRQLASAYVQRLMTKRGLDTAGVYREFSHYGNRWPAEIAWAVEQLTKSSAKKR